MRRVVEGASGALTRRTALLESGDRIVLSLDIVAPGEEALPPGRYTAIAEYRADPAWQRIGLPMWRSPNGPVYSPRVTFVVTDED